MFSDSLSILSAETIREHSHGEVVKPATLHYEKRKPIRQGLFASRIFGRFSDDPLELTTVRMRVAHARNEVLWAMALREGSWVPTSRFGHVELAVPVCHPLMLGWQADTSRGDMFAPSVGTIDELLDRVVYCHSYVVIHPAGAPIGQGDLLSLERYRELRRIYGDAFQADTGASAIRRLRAEAPAEGFWRRLSQHPTACAVLDVLPVLPTALRPMIARADGKWDTSDINDLYRRAIQRNVRVARLLELGAPAVILNLEKESLQLAVDNLFINPRRGIPATTNTDRPLNSLLDLLKATSE